MVEYLNNNNSGYSVNTFRNTGLYCENLREFVSLAAQNIECSVQFVGSSASITDLENYADSDIDNETLEEVRILRMWLANKFGWF